MDIEERSILGLGVGEEGVIVGYLEETVESLRLQEMGVLKGERVLMARKGMFEGTMEVQVKGYRLSIRKEEARMVLIKE